jgi:hypothetical protein
MSEPTELNMEQPAWRWKVRYVANTGYKKARLVRALFNT